ncbi:hypothetical protein SLS55_003540 [Diplodia seriata]|uniref:U-box domain-containing protein n=1 Tax=Diplodia seriata TaxID=420778 RepID=A0ABR3CRH5_9PEZI
MAIECNLIPCIHTYKAEVGEGEATETLLQTTEMAQSGEGHFPMNTTDPFVAVPMPCLINGTSYDASAFSTHPNKTHKHPVPNYNRSNNATTRFYVPSECVFSFGAIANLGAYLPTFLQGHIDLWEGIPFKSEPSWLMQVYDDANATLAAVDETWAALAASMTLQMRRDGVPGDSSAPATGSVWKTETCVSVQWEFLAYPAALLGLSVVFLAVTIWKSAPPGRWRRAETEAGMMTTTVERGEGRRRRWQVDCWKGSSLAVLFHGVGEGLREECRRAEGVKEMEEVARVVRVQVRDEGGGYELVKM